MFFPSKKDIWMGVIIWAVIAGCGWILYESIFVRFDIVGIIIMPLMIYLMTSIWFYTRYTFEKDTLKISYGPIKWNINMQDINSIRETNNPFVAPALSMKKIEINYGKHKVIAISPKDKKGFINTLQMNNSRIQIKK
ncbi:PH domain-containing protein [Bacillus sp. 1P06AnD]|uniref:PH domain-containing protein n=1 Tax=Bacillus sp. 1P06AnD TaxID=3132208 RepID=UPI00399EFD2D